MIRVEASCFTMGSEEFVVEEPEHKVCLNSYYLGIYEVTQQKFENVRGYNPSRFKGPAFSYLSFSAQKKDGLKRGSKNHQIDFHSRSYKSQERRYRAVGQHRRASAHSNEWESPYVRWKVQRRLR